jgi:uncharacterized delta-60 repeat protein
MSLTRFDPQGNLDLGFGTLGTVTAAVGTWAEGVALAPRDPSIIVAGSALVGSSRQVALVQFLPNGQPDPMFGTGGTVLADPGPGEDQANAVGMLMDGTTLVAGQAGDAAFLMRLHPDGTVDPDFGTGGVLLLDPSEGPDSANAITVSPYGAVSVGGRAGDRFFVARFQTNGQPDLAWGPGGVVIGTSVATTMW